MEAGVTGMPMVSLTLMNEDKSAPVAVVYVDYPSNRLAVRWTNSPCQDAKAAATEDFGTNTGSLKYACSKIFSHAAHDFKKFVASSTLSPYVKDHWGPLSQYADSLPSAYDWTQIYTNLDRGRRVEASVITRALPGEKQGEVPAATLAYAKTVGQAFLNWVSNDDATIGAYPAQ